MPRIRPPTKSRPVFVNMFNSPHLLALIHVCHDPPGSLDDVSLSRVLGCRPSIAKGGVDAFPVETRMCSKELLLRLPGGQREGPGSNHRAPVRIEVP